MQSLPNMMVLDFCEWLRKQVASGKNNKVDALDIVLNEEYQSRLLKYAKEFLSVKGGNPIRALLHRFIDSEEFSECLRRCHPHCQNGNYPWQRIHPEELWMLIHDCIHCCEYCFERFLRHNENIDQEIWFEGEVSPYDLVSYMKSSITHDGPMRMEFLQSLVVNMSVEVDFLEWLVQTRGKPIKIDEMPLVTFEALADEYCTDCRKNESDKKQIVRAFKQSGSTTLAIKLLSVLPKTEWKQMKSLGYIVDRYTNNRAAYKCIILPLRAEAEAYKELMGPRYWYDLNDLSGDYLDIFYSQADYGKSGYAIANQLNFLPSALLKKVPSIVLWGSDMNRAQNISIDDLDNPDIFKVIRTIVEAIQQSKDITNIIEEANNMAKELRDKNRPIIDNSLTIGGDNYGNAVAGTSNRVSSTIANDFSEGTFKEEVEEAITLIRKCVDINEQQKEALVNIVSEAKDAVEKKDEDAKKECKSKFKYFALGLGNSAAKLLSALSAMANLAKFFGLVSP